MNLTKIKTIAHHVRKQFENNTVDVKRLMTAYHSYNPIKNTCLFLQQAQRMFPQLNCGLTTCYLQTVLGGKIVQGTYKNNSHTFLLLQNTFVVDITADQYGGPKVYVGTLRNPWTI